MRVTHRQHIADLREEGLWPTIHSRPREPTTGLMKQRPVEGKRFRLELAGQHALMEFMRTVALMRIYFCGLIVNCKLIDRIGFRGILCNC